MLCVWGALYSKWFCGCEIEGCVRYYIGTYFVNIPKLVALGPKIVAGKRA